MGHFSDSEDTGMEVLFHMGDQKLSVPSSSCGMATIGYSIKLIKGRVA